MTQEMLPFQYEVEEGRTGMTGLGGLPVYLELMHRMGLNGLICDNLHNRGRQGYTDAQIVTALMFLNLAGGESVEDVRVLEADGGFCRLLQKAEDFRKTRKLRKEEEKRFRKQGRSNVPSPSSIFRYLEGFDEKQERQPGAWIPELKDLGGFRAINKGMIGFLQKNNPKRTATLDMDATLVETLKSDALYSYKGYKAYQPLNVLWHEHNAVLHTEFRDGNVPASYDNLRMLKKSISMLPEGVEEVYFRSDSAAYQHDIMKFCIKNKIGFAIAAEVSKGFKEDASLSEWSPFYKEIDGKLYKTDQEYALVNYIPDAPRFKKKDEPYRYIAIREPLLEQGLLPDFESVEYPFPVMDMDNRRYKITAIVTNLDWDAQKVINWFRLRCGKCEEAHSVMKSDLAGGRLPSDKFGANAAWWWIMILSLNLNSIMKTLVLDESWVSKRMKAIRFSLINIPGRIINHARSLIIRISSSHPASELLLRARETISLLCPA